MTFLVTTFGCVHDQNAAKSVDEPEVIYTDNGTREFLLKSKTMSASYIIYEPNMKDDVDKLFAQGKISEAMSKLFLDHKPTKVEDKAIHKLIIDGFVPVYVRVKNNGSQPLKISENTFRLIWAGAERKPYLAKDLPEIFEKFDPTTRSAEPVGGGGGTPINGVASVVGAVIAVAWVGIFQPKPDAKPVVEATEDDGRLSGENDLAYQSDYRAYLLHDATVAPGEVVKGLVFFPGGRDLNWPALRLRAL